MPIRISTATKNAILEAVRDAVRSGSTVDRPYISVRSGTQPAGVHVPATGTQLAVLQMAPNPFFPASNGSMLARPINNDISIDADGVAGWFRVYNRDNVGVLDGSVSVNGGSGQLQFDTITFVLGGAVALEAFTLGYDL